MVLLPTRRPLSLGNTETTFPETVAALPPALMMAPFGRVTIPLKGALGFWTPFCSRPGIAVGAGRPKVLASTTILLEPAETTWPETVAWLPGAIVEPATTTPPPRAVWIDWPLTAGRFVGNAGGTENVLASTMTLLEPAKTTCPAIVAWDPGATVEPATTIPPPAAVWID